MQPVDEDRFHDVIADYLRQIDRGEQVDRDEILARHAEFAEPLRRYFEGVDVVEEMAGPRVATVTPATVAPATVTPTASSKAGSEFDNPLQEATLLRSMESTGGSLPGSRVGEPIPESFGRYKILKALGQGAMGAVYLAHDTQLDREVALKIPKFGGADAHDLLERFYREARSAAALRHPNLCPVFDVGEINGQHYITMAFIKGRPLKEFTRAKKRQPERQVAAVIRKLALGLAQAHAVGVIHRDLKPANIMVDTTGEPVVMDFGLARRTAAGEAQMTHSGMIVGTPAYMSPEQVEGDQKKIGPAVDIYALGVIFYELLTGQLPFQGGLMSILKQIAVDQPPVPSQLRPGLDPQLEAICLRMMAKSQAERYGSMTEVSQALMVWLKAPAQPAAETAAVATAVTAPHSTRTARPKFALETIAAPVVPREPARPSPRASLLLLQMREQARRVPPRVWLLTAAALLAVGVLYGVTTLYLRLGKVDVQVVIDDPRLTLTIDGETVTFAGSEEPIRLSPGERAFVVEGRGLKAETDSFTVSRDGRNVLRVSVIDGRIEIGKHDQPLAKRTAAPAARVVLHDSFETPDVGDQDKDGQHYLESRNDGDATVAPGGILRIGPGPGYGSGGVADPGDGKYTGAGHNPGDTSIPGGEGHQMAFIGAERKESVSLTLVDPIAKIVRGTQYELSVAVGFSKDVKPGDKTWIELLAGVEVMAATEIPPVGLEQGRLKHFTTSFAAVGDSGTGQELRVRLRTYTAGPYIQMNFDNVRVTASPVRQPQESGWQGWPADAPPPAIAPFDAAQAKQHQEAWAKYLKVPVEYTNSIGMKFRLIPPGEFLMGSTPNEIEAALKFLGEDEHEQKCAKSEAPKHNVILAQPIFLGIHEVTQANYIQVMGKNPSHFAATGAGKDTVAMLDTTNHPVETVSWNDAAEFCAKLSEREKLKPFKFELRAGETVTIGTGYRLPIEAEWEYACRAGTMTKYWIGDRDEDLVQAGWFGPNSGRRTHAVGELKANPFGLFDIHGNAWEWVHDWWEAEHYGRFAETSAVNPNGPLAGSHRVIRGGAWDFSRVASYCRSAYRNFGPPDFRRNDLGFRVVLSIDAVKLQTSRSENATPKWQPTAAFQQWMKDVSALPAEQQVDAVVKKLQELNLGYDGNVVIKEFAAGGVWQLLIATDQLTDISPLAALRSLTRLNLNGSASGKGQLRDLGPLNGLSLFELGVSHNPGLSDLTPLRGMPLNTVLCSNTSVSDLTPLQGMKLKHFGCVGTPVSDLTPLDGMPLTHLEAYYTKIEDVSPLANCKSLIDLRLSSTLVTDLSPLKKLNLKFLEVGATGIRDVSPLRGMPLGTLNIVATKVADLSPLTECPLASLSCDFVPTRDTEILRSIKSLVTINGKPAAEFWKEVDARQAEFQKWMDGVAKLTAEQQFDAVVKKLQELNPGYDGNVYFKTLGEGTVLDFFTATDQLTDISPLMALPGLRRLKLEGSAPGKGKLTDLSPLRKLPRVSYIFCHYNPLLSDLSPLKGLPLDELNCFGTAVRDLSPLRGMPLKIFNGNNTPIFDLAPLRGLQLVSVDISGSQVAELSPLAGCKLQVLSCAATRVSDLSVLKGMPLKHLNCEITGVSDLTPLRGMQLSTLQLNGTPVASLAVLQGMPLEGLAFLRTKVTNLTPIKDCPLKLLKCDFDRQRDTAILRSIKSLEAINDLPVAEFWKALPEYPDGKPEPFRAGSAQVKNDTGEMVTVQWFHASIPMQVLQTDSIAPGATAPFTGTAGSDWGVRVLRKGETAGAIRHIGHVSTWRDNVFQTAVTQIRDDIPKP